MYRCCAHSSAASWLPADVTSSACACCNCHNHTHSLSLWSSVDRSTPQLHSRRHTPCCRGAGQGATCGLPCPVSVCWTCRGENVLSCTSLGVQCILTPQRKQQGFLAAAPAAAVPLCSWSGPLLLTAVTCLIAASGCVCCVTRPALSTHDCDESTRAAALSLRKELWSQQPVLACRCRRPHECMSDIP